MGQHLRPVNRLKDNLAIHSKLLWIALQSYGFSKDSIISFALILLRFLGMPVAGLKEPKRKLNIAICSLVCIAISSAAISIPSEATPLIIEADIAVIEASAVPSHNCAPMIQANYSSEQESYALSFSCDNEFNEQGDSLSEGEEKNKRFAVRSRELADSKAFFPGQSPNLRHFQSHNIVAWDSLHGNQLQLYNSGDEPDSSIPTYFPQTFLRPPHINNGGLFRALRANRHHILLFRHHSRPIKTTKQFSGGSIPTRANESAVERRFQDTALQPAHIANPVKRWLLYQSLLL